MCFSFSIQLNSGRFPKEFTLQCHMAGEPFNRQQILNSWINWRLNEVKGNFIFLVSTSSSIEQEEIAFYGPMIYTART
jgi:hypothetical protein